MSETDCTGSENLISVIVPVYKAEEYLPRCLDSLVSQTHRKLEIILVDDGSPDGSGEICDRYAAQDERIVVIHSANRGAYAARNTALDIARGSYISFVDADDWINPEMFEKLLRLMLETGADISQCEMKNEGEYAQIRNRKFDRTVVYEREELTNAFFAENIAHGLLGKLFRAEIWTDRRFDEAFYHVDAMTMAKMSEYCGRFARMDDELYHYNTTNSSITRGKRKPLHIRSKEKLFEVFSDAARNASTEGDFFICREIPSTGRLILPGGEITGKMAVEHIRKMHVIFLKHWPRARTSVGYREAPGMKKMLWALFGCVPVTATILVRIYAGITGKMF